MFLEIIETHKNGFLGEWSERSNPEIIVVMPTTDIAQAVMAAQRMSKFAGMPMRMVIVHDVARQGFIKIINDVSNHLKPNYLAYVAQDALAGKNWLKNAYEQMTAEKKSVCAFNDGQFWGGLAQFGLVRVAFTATHYGAHHVFCTQYTQHRADDELTLLAKLSNEFTFARHALLMEVDYSLGKKIHQPDILIYNDRVKAIKAQFADANTA